MNEEEYINQILSKMEKTVGDNNYKLLLSLTGHRTGKIRDVTLASKEAELLIEYVEQLRAVLKDIEEYLESIKDMPDADMYIKLGEYKEFKHILDLIHKGSE